MYKIKKTKTIIQLFIIALVFFGITTGVQAYDMPIGIPDAWIDPDITAPSLPSAWDSEQAGYYFVNYESGSDSHTYGTPSAPRQTIPRPIPAGSVVVLQGSYSYITAGAIWVQSAGTSDNPVWLLDYDGTGRLDTSSAKCIIYGSYLYVDGIDMDGSNGTTNHGMLQIGSMADGYEVNHVMFRNATITGNTAMVRTSGLSIIGNNIASASSDIIIYNSNIGYTGDITSPDDDDAHVVTVGNWSNNVWIINNEIHHGSGSATQIGGVYESEGYDNCHHVYYGRNHLHDTRQAGTGGKFFEHGIFSENYIHDIIDTSWSEAKGIGFQYHNDYVWIIYNTIIGGRFGIKGSSDNTDDILHHYIIGNLITDVDRDGAYTSNYHYEEAGIGLWGSDNQQVILNNTIDNCDSGIVMVYDNIAEISNNIISNRAEPTGHDLALPSTTVNDYINNNNWYGSSLILEYNGTTYTSVSALDTATGGSGSIDSDPLYISPTDRHLQSSSPARNAGITSTALNTNVYDLYQSLYGVDIKKDIENNFRPQGSGWDIGAYEYVENQTVRADVDNNSTINTTDAMLTLRNSLGLSMSGTNWFSSATTGDVNCDNVSNSTDAMLILRHSLGLDMSGTGWCE